MSSMVVFLLDGQRHALAIEAVERVARAVRVMPLPRAPRIVAGAIDLHGRIVPVLDIRSRLRLPARRISLTDCLVVARAGPRTVAFLADSVPGTEVVDASDITAADSVVPGLEGVKGLAATRGGMVIIQDLDRFLSLDEAQALDDALAR